MAKTIDDGLLRLQEQAKIFGVPSKYALGVVRLGEELRMTPMMSLLKVRFVGNRATLTPLTMLSIVNASEKLEDISIADDGCVCRVMMKRNGRAPHEESFSMEDAERLGLLKLDHWERYPKSMRRLRAATVCSRMVFPDLVGGFLTPEEAGADVNESGEMIEINPISKASKRFGRIASKAAYFLYERTVSFACSLKAMLVKRRAGSEVTVEPSE